MLIVDKHNNTQHTLLNTIQMTPKITGSLAIILFFETEEGGARHMPFARVPRMRQYCGITGSGCIFSVQWTALHGRTHSCVLHA